MDVAWLVSWDQLAFLFLGFLIYKWGYRRGQKDTALKYHLTPEAAAKAIERATTRILKEKI